MFARLMGLNTVSPDELHRLITSGQVTTIDVNSRQSWSRAHVPGALNMDPVEFANGDLPTDKTAKLVFYCSNSQCRKAPNTARRAKKMGYSDVGVMAAGISGWMRAELPTESNEVGRLAGRVTVGALNSRSIPYKVGPDSGLERTSGDSVQTARHRQMYAATPAAVTPTKVRKRPGLLPITLV